MIRSLLALAIPVALAGCVTGFSVEDCPDADWYEQGRAVAADGARDLRAALAHYQRVRGAAGVDPNLFQLGFEKGAGQFCAPRRAFRTVARREQELRAFDACGDAARVAAVGGLAVRPLVDEIREARVAQACPVATDDGEPILACSAFDACVSRCVQDPSFRGTGQDTSAFACCRSLCMPPAEALYDSQKL